MTQFKPVSAKWLDENHRFALGWQGPDDEIAYSWHRIEGRRFVRFKPFMQGFNALASRGTQAAIQLKDINSDDILKVSQENASKIIKHVGIGIAPDYMRVYYRFPDSADVTRVDNTQPTTVGDDKGFVTGFDSPYHEPTDALEFFFPYSIVATFNHMNPQTLDPTSSSTWPKYNVEMMQYRVSHLDPNNPQDAALIAAMAAGKTQVRLFTMGPPDAPVTYPGSLKTLWEVEPVTLREAKKLHGSA